MIITATSNDDSDDEINAGDKVDSNDSDDAKFLSISHSAICLKIECCD